MLVDRIIYPITTLGPGERLVIWFAGCSKQCHNCSNPELWYADPAKDIEPDRLLQALEPHLGTRKLDGITLTGGDPLEQFDALIAILPRLRHMTGDILLYTGYTLDELPVTLGIEQFDVLRQNISVLIDGPYVDHLNDSQSALRGSTNQQLHFFDDQLRDKYNLYLERGRRLQNVFYQDRIISVGVPIRSC